MSELLLLLFLLTSLKPIIDIAQILINDDRMFQAITDLPEKANFISVVTTLVTNAHFDEIRSE